MSYHITGVQRYLLEILSRVPNRVEKISPKACLHGVAGHAWEQCALPFLQKDRLLWSPSNAGPVVSSRQVVTIHDMVTLDHPEWFRKEFAMWYKWMTPKLLQNVVRVIAVSEFTKQRIIENLGIEPNKIEVIHNGVDERFKPQSSAVSHHVRTYLDIPSPHYILALGSLEPRKGLRRLIQAWGQISGVLPCDIWLVISGAKGNSKIFQKFSLDVLPARVHFTGHVPDEMLPGLYSGALAFAYLSEYEGFGLPPLEAMAAGTPSLTGNLASLPEVVGKAGIMVDPYDIEAIADGLRRLVEDRALRETLRAKGLERAKLFSWDSTAKLTWKVLQEATEQK